MGKQWKQWQTLFWGSKITADGDCSLEVKRHLLLGRKVMTNLDSILKSRDIALPTKFCLVKAIFLVVMYGCESWTLKKAEHWRIDAFELRCWKSHIHRQLANLITWTTALSNWMKLSHAVWGHPRWEGHGGEVWQKVVHWRRKWQNTSVFLP